VLSITTFEKVQSEAVIFTNENFQESWVICVVFEECGLSGHADAADAVLQNGLAASED
jgi:hypothetical protein